MCHACGRTINKTQQTYRLVISPNPTYTAPTGEYRVLLCGYCAKSMYDRLEELVSA